VLIAIVVILSLYQPVKVKAPACSRRSKMTSACSSTSSSYRFGISEIKRGDTVVFWYPNDTSKSYIKRVIGLPATASS
jgi:signal peptidase I